MARSGEDFGGLFLGPKAENQAVLTEMLLHVVVDHFMRRRRVYEDDLPLFSLEAQESAEYQAVVGKLRRGTLELLRRLDESVPWYSPRYMAHMNSDVLLSAIVGYVAAMLHNSNNVVLESSPATSRLELEAVDDLLEMVGFPKHDSAESPKGWGHFTSGGHVANIEALWVYRNMKYFPLALRSCADPCIDIPIELPNGHHRGLFQRQPLGTGAEDEAKNTWELLNLPFPEILGLRAHLISSMKHAYTNGKLAWLNVGDTAEERARDLEYIERRVDSSFTRENGVSVDGLWKGLATSHPGVVITTTTSHYSVSKAVELLGIGRDQLTCVPLSSNLTLDTGHLRSILLDLAEKRIPVLALVAVFGSTEEGAIDPIHDICDLRDEMARTHGLYFPVHVDAAYGGYLRCLFRDERGRELQPNEVKEYVGLEDYPTASVFAAQAAMTRAESVTIDPHKHGYIPYPAGCVLFKDERVRDLVSFQAPYLWRGDDNILTGSYTLEGSRPGATAASVWLTQRVLPLSREGHGELIRGSIRNAQRLYGMLVESDPIELASGQKVRILPLARPDFTTVCFFVNPEGNTRLEAMNNLVAAIAKEFGTPDDLEGSSRNSFYVAKTELRYSAYGESIRDLLNRLGIKPEDYSDDLERDDATRAQNVASAIRMCVMHPWQQVRVGPEGADYIGMFMDALRDFLRRELLTY